MNFTDKIRYVHNSKYKTLIHVRFIDMILIDSGITAYVLLVDYILFLKSLQILALCVLQLVDILMQTNLKKFPFCISAHFHLLLSQSKSKMPFRSGLNTSHTTPVFLISIRRNFNLLSKLKKGRADRLLWTPLKSYVPPARK